MNLIPEREKVVLTESLNEASFCRRDSLATTRHVLGQSHVETALHLEIRIVQIIHGATALLLFFSDGQISGLEQQCFSTERIEFEIRDKICVYQTVFHNYGTDLPLHQQPVQVAGFPGPEPLCPKLAFIEEMKNVVRIVEFFIAKPVVPVVPCPNPVSVKPFQFRGKHGIQIVIRISTDRGIPGRQADVREVVETGRKAGFREHRDTGCEYKTDMFFGVFENTVQITQLIPVCPGFLLVFRYIYSTGRSYSSTSTTFWPVV